MRPLVVEGLTALKDGHVLLEQIHFEVRTGQVTGIVSDNPDRLSLLLNIIGGVEKENSGRILFGGRPLSHGRRLREVGVAREQVSLVDTLPVIDNLFLSNNQRFTKFGFILKAPRRTQASTVLRKLESQVPLDIPVQKVAPGTKVLLDVARVAIKDPSYLIFNSVTRSMGLRQYDAFLSMVKGWKTTGKGIIIVPINAEDIRNLVDRLYFLQGTQLFEVEKFRDLTDEQLHDYFVGTVKKRFQSANDPIYQAKQMIDDRAADADINFQSLADHLAMGYDNFRRRFKKQIGQSPNQYFLSAKVDRAKELLLFTDLEIKDIAMQIGFSDPYYFSRVFKEKTGISPGHFRDGSRLELEK